MKRAVFLDRDGVINKVQIRDGRVVTPRSFSQFELVEGIGPEVRRIRQAGFFVFVITNQPDVARGLLPVEELDRMSAAIRSQVPVDEVWVCPHDDDAGCDCRKPKPGMVLRARAEYGIAIEESYLIGDDWKDMELARAVGCRGLLIDAPYNQGVSSFQRVRNVREAVNLVLSS